MDCRISDLRDKQVVCINNGCSLGPVCDVEFNTATGQLTALVIYGKMRCFGLMGRCDDVIIPWCEIKVIGPDTILVGINPPEVSRRSIFNKFQR